MKPRLISILLAVVLISGCAVSFPGERSVQDARDAAAAEALLNSSIQAHGGYLFDQPAAVRVSYEGRWWRLVRILQPGLTDAGYRKRSDEVLFLAQDRLEQLHTGPKGEKKVIRGADSIEVSYNGEPDELEKTEAAAALVADAYTMFLSGPSFFRYRNAEVTKLDPEVIDGIKYERLSARLVPGLGLAEEDRVVIWIESESRRLDRVHFTLNGLASTQGAHVDVAFADHRTIDGYLWPTTFFERVRAPVRIKAHRWKLISLEVVDASGAPLSGDLSVRREEIVLFSGRD